MAVNNNSVTVTAGLLCSALSDPAIGSAGSAALMAYEDGDPATDNYVNVGTSPTALNAAMTLTTGEYGYVRVVNPSAVDVTVLIDATPDVTVGVIPPGCPALIPVSNGMVLLATVASGTATVGVTAVKIVANA